MPRYYCIDKSGLETVDGPMGVPVGYGEEWCAVYKTVLPGSSKKNPVAVYLIDHEGFFGRDGVYGIPCEPDFADNPRRFMFFSRSIFQLCKKIAWFPQILHAHDWPTAMVPVFLKYCERNAAEPTGSERQFCDTAEGFAQTASVLTIHNLGYQGVYSKDFFSYAKLDPSVFLSAGFDDWDRMNLLKAGITCADTLTTVSPTYAEETKTHAYGFRLDGVLRARSDQYVGILNGIDTELWSPQRDAYIPKTFSRKDVSGKALAKEALQNEFGLPLEADVPVIGMVTRLTEQKGVGELFGPAYGSAWSICQDMHVQLLLLGSGEKWCEEEIRRLTSRLPNFKALIGYNERLSHLIEAGSDFFLMPSRYEPCGLNQMYSLSYGTLPIVRRTGGLADTVENFDQETGAGTGFMFNELTPRSVYDTVGWAVWAYYNRREQVEAMRLRGMAKDFSWKKSARKYEALYAGTRPLLG
jgi:starch synthase